MTAPRARLDTELVRRGLARSREQAGELVAALAIGQFNGDTIPDLAVLYSNAAAGPVTVTIVNGHITGVKSGTIAVNGAEVIDLSRFTGLPGLIDLHTHATYYWDGAAGTSPLTTSPFGDVHRRSPKQQPTKLAGSCKTR